MTLTSELLRDMIKVNPSTKFWVRILNGSAVRALTDRQTHTQTGPILYPSTIDAGANNGRNQGEDQEEGRVLSQFPLEMLCCVRYQNFCM